MKRKRRKKRKKEKKEEKKKEKREKRNGPKSLVLRQKYLNFLPQFVNFRPKLWRSQAIV